MTRSDLALAALATAAVPGMKPVSVVGVRASADQPEARHQVAFVEDATGRKWVVRAPLDAAAGAELERNDPLVRMLGRYLPFKVPAAAGYADLGRDGRAAVYPYVDGAALDFRHLPPGPGLASAVGRAVAAVHNIPRDLFEEAGVPVFDAAGYRARKLAELDRAAETGHVPTGLLARWEQALESAPLWQFATTPTHGTLDGSSFLVAFTGDDAATGRVVALTGWENAQVADPADDFAALVRRASPQVVDAVFDSYAIARSQRPDGYLIHRARLASELQLVTGLARAVAGDDIGFVRERADRLRKLDRLTSVDDSLVPRTALVVAGPTPTPGPSQERESPVTAEAAEGTSGVIEVSEASSDLEPAHPPEPGGEQPGPEREVPAAQEDPTEEIPSPVTAPEEGRTPTVPEEEGPTPPPADEEEGPRPSPADEEERLHTLYGMPADDDEDPGGGAQDSEAEPEGEVGGGVRS